MGILKFVLILIICLLSPIVKGQTTDTTIWNVYLFEGDSIIQVIKTDVVIQPIGIAYKDSSGKYIYKEKDYFLSREKLNNKNVKEYYKP